VVQADLSEGRGVERNPLNIKKNEKWTGGKIADMGTCCPSTAREKERGTPRSIFKAAGINPNKTEDVCQKRTKGQEKHTRRQQGVATGRNKKWTWVVGGILGQKKKGRGANSRTATFEQTTLPSYCQPLKFLHLLPGKKGEVQVCYPDDWNKSLGLLKNG